MEALGLNFDILIHSILLSESSKQPGDSCEWVRNHARYHPSSHLSMKLNKMSKQKKIRMKTCFGQKKNRKTVFT